MAETGVGRNARWAGSGLLQGETRAGRCRTERRFEFASPPRKPTAERQRAAAGTALQAPQAGSSSIEATPRARALLQLLCQWPSHMRWSDRRDRASRQAVEASSSAGSPHSTIYWEMDCVIFDRSAADWMIPLRFKRGAMIWVRRQRVARPLRRASLRSNEPAMARQMSCRCWRHGSAAADRNWSTKTRTYAACPRL
jgi:hypothetical protein